jgi:hypothetical protein
LNFLKKTDDHNDKLCYLREKTRKKWIIFSPCALKIASNFVYCIVHSVYSNIAKKSW